MISVNNYYTQINDIKLNTYIKSKCVHTIQ